MIVSSGFWRGSACGEISRDAWRASQVTDCSNCMALKLNRYVTQVSQRVHLHEIRVIFASGDVRVRRPG